MNHKPKRKSKKEWHEHWDRLEANKRRNDFYDNVVRDFKRMGFTVETRGQAYCFNESITVDPCKREFENLRTGEKGSYKGQNVNNFIRAHFGLSVQ